MTDAKRLLLDLLAVIPDGDKSAAFFAEDGVLELPFLPTRHQGHAPIKEFYNYVGGTLYPDFRVKPEDTKVLIDTPDQVFAEYGPHQGCEHRESRPSAFHRAACGRKREDQAAP
jgi:hypothetical protein